MEVKVSITTKKKHERLPRFTTEVFTEDDLLEWAKDYVAKNYSDGTEVEAVEVESIVP